MFFVSVYITFKTVKLHRDEKTRSKRPGLTGDRVKAVAIGLLIRNLYIWGD